MQTLGIFAIQPDTEDAKVQLFKLLKIKDYVAEYIWYLLAGILVSSVTYNYIVNVGCNFSSAQMKQEYNRFLSSNQGSSGTDADSQTQNLQAAQNIITS